MAEVRTLERNRSAVDRALARERDAGGRRNAARAGDFARANDPDQANRRIRRVSRIEPALAAAVTPASTAPSEVVREIALERVMGGNDMVSVAYLELALSAARSVCRVHLRLPGGRVAGYGTGFLVSPRLLLTNHHVLGDAEAAGTALAEFDYQDDCKGQPLEPASFDLDPGRFFASDADLDWALVAVQEASRDGAALDDFGWLPLIGTTGKAANAEFLNIIQHPNGEPKQMALRENRLVDMLERHLHYESDTAPGSSGSPVFNDQWEVVALHHAAYPRTVGGQVMAVGGKPWTRDMGEDRIDWVGNEGVRVSVLVEALRRLRPQGAGAARLIEELLAGGQAPFPPFPRRGGAAGAKRPAAPSLRREARGAAAPVEVGDGGATWVVPIEVTVRVGSAGGAGAAAAATRAHGDRERPTPERPAGSDATRPSAGQTAAGLGAEAEVARFLELHRAAEGRPYYDGDADRAARDRYYRGVNRNAASEDLRAALSDLLQRTHQPKRYRPLEFVYPWVDKRRDGTLRSIYSGKPFSAEEIVRADVEVEHELARRREAMSARMPGGERNPRFAESLDILEASLPFNCEHVVPQSWFGKSEPQRGDIHHLFTCESGCNSFRGNTPFWDFPDFEEAVRDACGRRDTRGSDTSAGRFEPSAGKGAVARATLYFLLRYPGGIDERYDGERLEMLLGWHRSRRVDEWERHRNAAVQELQGNRNPLIDFPELAERLFA